MESLERVERVILPESSGRVCVAVVDDQLLLREGIATLLDADPQIEVVGRGLNGQEAIDLCDVLHPDIVLMDIRMPVLDGIQATREIKARWPRVRVILTSYLYDGYVVEALMAGADGYMLKDTVPAALISGVITVATGQKVLEPSVAQHVTDLLNKHSGERHDIYDGLTQRELQVVSMVARLLRPQKRSRISCASAKRPYATTLAISTVNWGFSTAHKLSSTPSGRVLSPRSKPGSSWAAARSSRTRCSL